MKSFLERISSRKFLIAVAVQVAAVAALFWPDKQSAINDASVQIAALAAMVLAAFGYGKINVDETKQASQTDVSDDQTTDAAAEEPDDASQIAEDAAEESSDQQ